MTNWNLFAPFYAPHTPPKGAPKHLAYMQYELVQLILKQLKQHRPTGLTSFRSLRLKFSFLDSSTTS